MDSLSRAIGAWRHPFPRPDGGPAPPTPASSGTPVSEFAWSATTSTRVDDACTADLILLAAIYRAFLDGSRRRRPGND